MKKNMEIDKRRNQLFTAITLSLTMGAAVAQFTSEVELSEISDTGAGFVLNGVNAYDTAGASVSGAGDINGDGFDDIIIGARFAYSNGSRTGASYVVFGQAKGFETAVELSKLDGSDGFVLNGVNAENSSGYSVSDIGDVNGDGFDDIVVGTFSDNVSYVVFGKSGNFDAAVELATLDGSDGFVLVVMSNYGFGSTGRSVSGAGDVNGDGFDDIIIGAPSSNPNGDDSAGVSYVVFGHGEAFEAVLDLSALDGNDGFVLNGVSEDDNSGSSVGRAGDVNGDGFDDIIIGARFAGPYGFASAGAAYVVFGKDSDFAATVELSSLDGGNGFVLDGTTLGGRLGESVSGAGDVNGDGFDDIIIGASEANPNGENSGASYVVFGKPGGFNAVIELSDLDGSDGFVLNGVAEYYSTGRSVSALGDINDDGFDDVIIGAPGADPNGEDSGGSYVVFGKASSFEAIVELSELNGSDGFVLNGIAEGDVSGRRVSGAGDVNGDGFDDVIIAGPRVDTNGIRSGANYVVFGSFQCQSGGNTYQVNSAAQLNHAIDCANQSGGTNTIELTTDINLRTFFDDVSINLPDGTSVEIGKTGLRAIESAVTLDGQGYTLKRGDFPCELNNSDADGEFRLLRLFGSDAALSLKNIKLLNGCADGISTDAGSGGGIYMGNSIQDSMGGASLRIENSVINNHRASTAGGGIYIQSDAAVFELIDSTTFNGNSAGRGGGIYSNGAITQIQNSTFSSNEAIGFSFNTAQGGAIWSLGNINGMNNNTFYNNEAIGGNSSGGALYFGADAMGIENNLFFSNLADDGPDCTHVLGVSVMGENNLSRKGFNLCPNAGIAEPVMSLEVYSLVDNGCLKPFADGSCARTHAIGKNSAAKNAANLNATVFDQRGFGQTGIRDVGAFEYDGLNFDVIFKDNFE